MTMSSTCTSCTPVLTPRTAPFGARLALWAALRRERRALSRLDDAGLQDIGLDRRDVARELRRSLWNAPAYWRR